MMGRSGGYSIEARAAAKALQGLASRKGILFDLTILSGGAAGRVGEASL